VPATGNWDSDADWGAWENSGRVFKPVNHFYPAAGYRYYNTSATLYSSGNLGYYWVSGAYTTKLAWRLTFYSSDVYPQSLSDRANGQSIRCIKEQ